MRKILLGGALLGLAVILGLSRADASCGVAVSRDEASSVVGACPGTVFATVTSCTGPCALWGGGVDIQTLSGGLGNGSLVNFDCGCGTWYDTWVYTDCGGG